jgi:hypothetical protein
MFERSVADMRSGRLRTFGDGLLIEMVGSVDARLVTRLQGPPIDTPCPVSVVELDPEPPEAVLDHPSVQQLVLGTVVLEAGVQNYLAGNAGHSRALNRRVDEDVAGTAALDEALDAILVLFEFSECDWCSGSVDPGSGH